MKTLLVKDVMVPLSEYATVNQETSLYEAVLALEKAQAEFDQTKYRHRAILILNENNKVVGKVSQLDVLRALEPRYREIDAPSATSPVGFSKKFLESMLNKYYLWDKPLERICQKAGSVKVKNFMYTPTEGEYVEEQASLDVAIHQLIMGRHQSLLVTRGEGIIGILRLTDVFRVVCDAMKACGL